MSNTIFNIIAADVVDYDELLTGMKRAASYTAVTNLPYMFVSVAGGSIPLALMSALGFEEPGDDDDNDDDDGNSTQGSTAVLRVWCSLWIGTIGLLGFLTLRYYKVMSCSLCYNQWSS
jgi:Na+/melibiose symporter-like transporter